MTVTGEITRNVLLPGLGLFDRPAGPRPGWLLRPGTMLLTDVVPGRAMTRRRHRQVWGEAPHTTRAELIEAAAAVDLRGAGGAGFPTARKLISMGRRADLVVVNGSEGEPSSGKDGVLLRHVPHLVLDGAAIAARALNASRIVIRVAVDQPETGPVLSRAIAERPDSGMFTVSWGPARYVAGEATAVLSAVAGGLPIPQDMGRPPRLRRRIGHRRHPALLSNVETFARLAVAARGHQESSHLVTVSGAVSRPGVLELSGDLRVADLAGMADLIGSPRVLVSGGWQGTWLPWPHSGRAWLSRAGLESVGGRWGVGAFTWLPQQVDPADVLVAVARVLADESAGQCGPCRNGLPAVVDALARGDAEVGSVLDDVAGGGLCAHPTASAAAIRSGLAVIGGLS